MPVRRNRRTNPTQADGCRRNRLRYSPPRIKGGTAWPAPGGGKR